MAAELVQLDVTIDPGGTAFTVSELRALLPGIQLDVAAALERAAVRFTGRIEADGEDSDVSRVVARQLETLRQFSRQAPDALITVREADGGELRLQGGSFGADEAELSALLASVTGEPLWRLYVSFRIERDAHPHLIELIERALPPNVEPVFDASDMGLALGLDIHGTAERVADFVAIARFAWRQEGSEAECLVEVEGPLPIVELARTWPEWLELERRLRRSTSGTAPARAAATSALQMVKIATLGGACELLGERWLSWIDSEGQVFGIWRGAMYSLPERVECGQPLQGELRRAAGGVLYYLRGDHRVAIPPVAAGSERRFHRLLSDGALFSDTAGTLRASTQLVLVGERGIDKGPHLAHVRALDVSDTEGFALAEGQHGPALLQIKLGDGWGYAETRPWHHDETATDIAILRTGRIAITAERGSRSTLYLVESANLVYARRILVPCVAGQIVAHSRKAIWIAGTSTPPGSSRCDLFRVDVRSGTVALVTAELDAAAIECVATNPTDDDDLQLVFATDRAAYATAGAGLREIIELSGHESITGIVVGTPPAVFVQSSRGSTIVLGTRDATIPLPTAGYEPLIHDGPPS